MARRGDLYLIEELVLRNHRDQNLRSLIFTVCQDTVTHLAQCLPKQSLHTQSWPVVAALTSPFPLTSHNTLCSPLMNTVQRTYLAEKFTKRRKKVVSRGFAVQFDHAIEEKDANGTLPHSSDSSTVKEFILVFVSSNAARLFFLCCKLNN